MGGDPQFTSDGYADPFTPPCALLRNAHPSLWTVGITHGGPMNIHSQTQTILHIHRAAGIIRHHTCTSSPDSSAQSQVLVKREVVRVREGPFIVPQPELTYAHPCLAAGDAQYCKAHTERAIPSQCMFETTCRMRVRMQACAQYGSRDSFSMRSSRHERSSSVRTSTSGFAKSTRVPAL